MLHLWYMAMALHGTSFRGHGFGFLLLQPLSGVKTPLERSELEISKRKKINRPKTTQNPHASEILTLTYHYFFFDRIFTGFSQVWKGMQRCFCLSPCFLPGPQNPATLWKLKEVRCGMRFCLGGVMSVWYRSILFECFKWFAWWKSDGGFWMAYPFWQYYKARVELALPISSSETGPAGTTAFDALLFRSVKYFGLFVLVAEHSLTFCRGFPCISCLRMFTALAFVSKFLVEIVVSIWLKGWKNYLWD